MAPADVVVTQRRMQVAKLYLRAWTQAEIAVEVGVSQNCISKDLMAIQAEWTATTIAARDTFISRELKRLDHIEREAWGEWERSKLNAEETSTESSALGEKNRQVSKGQTGDPRYLGIVQACITERSKLLGLYAPTRQTVTSVMEHRVVLASMLGLDPAIVPEPRQLESESES